MAALVLIYATLLFIKSCRMILNHIANTAVFVLFLSFKHLKAFCESRQDV